MDGCAVLETIGSYQWNADVYGSLSIASEIAAAIRDRSAAIRLAVSLRRFNTKIGHSIHLLHEIMEGRIPANIKQTTDEPFTPERGERAIRLMRDLHCVLDDIYQKAKRQRFTNNSLIAGPLNKLHENSQAILDVADWLEMLMHHNEVEVLFNRARQEEEAGEIYDINQVQ